MLPLPCHAHILEQTVSLFGQVRDDWIRDDLAGWLAPNRIYEGVGPAVKGAMQRDEVYIVTTKQVRSGACLSPKARKGAL
jgi:hypothetical protein